MPIVPTTMKLVLADPKTGKSYKIGLEAAKEKEMIGKSIGMEIDTGFIGLPGYKMKITGGTDKNGFVMKKDLPGPAKRKILGATGIGFAPKINGQRRRKFIRGSEISAETAQVNAKIVVYGEKSIGRLLGLEPEEEPVVEEIPVEEAPAAEAPAEEAAAEEATAEEETAEE